jgi:4-alpha-glucanotransferase
MHEHNACTIGRLPRGSGILLHITSLPGAFGCGDLGPAAYEFVDLLSRTGQSLWQVLPLGPTGYGNSPYQSTSAFAGNPLLISLEKFAQQGWLTEAELHLSEPFDSNRVDFDAVIAWRRSRLVTAYRRFAAAGGESSGEFHQFRAASAGWLDEFALFSALKSEADERAWTHWPSELIHRHPEALAEARRRLAGEIACEIFIQYQFAVQWNAIREYAHAKHIRIMGDIPIFVAHDSADVWAKQDLFQLDHDGRPTFVAGVPPDYFSATGQLWGNPLYRWDVMAERGYAWWIERFRHTMKQFDLVRLDHFRGFEAYWEIPGDAPDARGGRWVPGPGIEFFRAAANALGPLPLVAEDLGVITPQVDALREEVGAPGMRVLQFAFGTDPKAAEYLPHNYPHHCVVYTGTHDNDTTAGWFHSQAGEGTTREQTEIDRERATILTYVGTDGSDIAWDMIRVAWSSVADTAIAPLQDVLSLGSEARFNLPGTLSGNWCWRVAAQQLTPAIEERLTEMTTVYERLPADRPPATDPPSPRSGGRAGEGGDH